MSYKHRSRHSYGSCWNNLYMNIAILVLYILEIFLQYIQKNNWINYLKIYIEKFKYAITKLD